MMMRLKVDGEKHHDDGAAAKHFRRKIRMNEANNNMTWFTAEG